jgi:hypothetical protein
MRQTRPDFVIMPQGRIEQDAAFGLTKNDPHPSRRRLRSLV